MSRSLEFGGLVAPLYRSNIDTDQIIPKQFLKSIKRSGFGRNLFFDWRYDPDGSPDPDFILNLPRYRGANVLLAGANFGCGSSREHAAWAIREFGIRSIIAPSFADIFYSNAVKSGILPIVLDGEHVLALVDRCDSDNGYEISIDLEHGMLTDGFGLSTSFRIDEHSRFMLLKGLDEIAATLEQEKKIRTYEQKGSYQAELLRRIMG